MYTGVALVFFLFGILIGSFLNVVALRYNSGRGITGRSQCGACGKTLRWWELVPVLSFILLRARCSRCSSPVSWQYPLVELCVGGIFAGIFLVAETPLELLFALVTFSILTVIVIYDTRHHIIPDALSYAFIALSFFRLFIDSVALSVAYPGVLALAAGPAVAAPLWLLWFASSGRWIGFGDVKLALGAGWFLGLSGGLSALALSFWVGAAVSIAIVGARALRSSGITKLNSVSIRRTMRTEVPFAPFIILGIALMYFFEINIIELLSF